MSNTEIKIPKINKLALFWSSKTFNILWLMLILNSLLYWFIINNTDQFSYSTLWLLSIPLSIYFTYKTTRKDADEMILNIEKRVTGNITESFKKILPIEVRIGEDNTIKKVSIFYLIFKLYIPISILIANIVCYFLF